MVAASKDRLTCQCGAQEKEDFLRQRVPACNAIGGIESDTLPPQATKNTLFREHIDTLPFSQLAQALKHPGLQPLSATCRLRRTLVER
jgi:hypothetical protein